MRTRVYVDGCKPCSAYPPGNVEGRAISRPSSGHNNLKASRLVETAEEIALSILGEIQAALTGRQGGSLRDHPGPIHDRPT